MGTCVLKNVVGADSCADSVDRLHCHVFKCICLFATATEYEEVSFELRNRLVIIGRPCHACAPRA